MYRSSSSRNEIVYCSREKTTPRKFWEDGYRYGNHGESLLEELARESNDGRVPTHKQESKIIVCYLYTSTLL